MRHLVFASTSLVLLLSGTSQAADSSAAFEHRPPQQCHADHAEASAPQQFHCADHPPHEGAEHGHFPPPPPPPHEPPLAAVKACLGKKNGAKTTLYLHGDSIPSICRPYDGMLLAKPLQPRQPPVETADPAD